MEKEAVNCPNFVYSTSSAVGVYFMHSVYGLQQELSVRLYMFSQRLILWLLRLIRRFSSSSSRRRRRQRRRRTNFALSCNNMLA